MKSITPMRKTKVLQTFGNRKRFLSLEKDQKANETKEYRLKESFFSNWNAHNP